MSDYTPVTEFVTKDTLSVNDPLKKVVGSELDAEFDAIATAIASKQDASESGAANGYAELNANAKLKPAQMWANVNAPAITTGAVTLDASLANQFYVVLTENITVNAPTNAQSYVNEEDRVVEEYYYPVVQFVASDGRSRTVQLGEGSSPPSYDVGDDVTIRYEPENPNDARIQSFSSSAGMWILPVITGILGIGFLVAVLAVVIVTSRSENST